MAAFNFPSVRSLVFLLCGLVLALSLSACGPRWVTVTPPPTPSATMTLLPTPEPSVTETPAPDTETPSPEPTLSLTPTASGTPTLTSTPLAPEDMLATFFAEATQTATAGKRGPKPTNTPLPSRTPTVTPTPTNTPTPTPPYAPFRIGRPGPMSRQVSPIKAEMYAIPGDDGRIMIDLIGEDGRYITRQILDYPRFTGRNIFISPQIPFEIKAVAETARLVVSSNDKFGRKIYLSSVDFLLLSVGDNELNLPGYQLESYLIRRPRYDDIISGGVLHLEGLARPVNDRPIIFDLTNEQGIVVGSAKETVPDPAGDLSHTPFMIDIPYQVSDVTPVRLIIRQESNTRIPGNVALVSMEVILAP